MGAGPDRPSLHPARCRLGDVVRVVDAYNQCPVVRFLRRWVTPRGAEGPSVNPGLLCLLLLPSQAGPDPECARRGPGRGHVL